MKKLVLLIVLIASSFLSGCDSTSIQEYIPIVPDTGAFVYCDTPIPQRNEKYNKWLTVTVGINVGNKGGSGTIVYYDPESGYAYIQTCGHLWGGIMDSKTAKSSNLKCTVIVYYKNDTKLFNPVKYNAEVLCYEFVPNGNDCGLIRFRPDWEPNYIPIASKYTYNPKITLHSCGLDAAAGKDPAHYEVNFMQNKNQLFIWTMNNSPRPGRSGGGLMIENRLVGICSATTDVSGNGKGVYTNLTGIRKLNESNGYGWLNKVGDNLANQIPIIDKNSPQGTYPKDYIPTPKSK